MMICSHNVSTFMYRYAFRVVIKDRNALLIALTIALFKNFYTASILGVSLTFNPLYAGCNVHLSRCIIRVKHLLYIQRIICR